jgi:ketose-bisphosphate aldolase
MDGSDDAAGASSRRGPAMTAIRGASGVPWYRVAHQKGFAIPAFNVSNMECIQAVVAAAEQQRSPVVLQLSPGVLAYAGYETIRDLAMTAAERAAVPVVVHLDHCRDPLLVVRALKDGFGSVMFDGSTLELSRNIEATREIVAEAARTGAAVEAELGEISGAEASSIDDARRTMTLPEDASLFVEATGIDMLAPAIGTLHRMPIDSVRLPLERIREIATACRLPLALHGGSGVDRAQLPAAIDAGIGKVNISSSLSRAFASGIQSVWARSPGEMDLRRFLGAGRDAVQELAAEYTRLTGSAGRIKLRAGTGPAWSGAGTEVE